MRKSQYKWFQKNSFLDEDLHKQMLIPENYNLNRPVIIDVDGNVNVGDEDFIKNRYKNNDILYTLVTDPVKQVLKLLEQELKNSGLINPVAFNLSTIIDPKTNRYSLNHGWHQDYNIVGHVTDPLRLWFTFLMLSTDVVESKFMVSPTSDGPEFWNTGCKVDVTSNMAIGHNMNLGHSYTCYDKQNLKIIYIPWFDAL